MENRDKLFNKEVSKWISKGYKIVDKNDDKHIAIMEKPNKVSHGLHIILSILTGGLWLIIYLFLLMSSKKESDTITISISN